MPFNPNLPANGSDGSSAEMRGQLNGLKQLIDAVPAGPPGADGAPGIQGPPGPPISSPLIGDAVIQGRFFIQQSELHITTNNDTGSGESGIALAASDGEYGPRLQIATRQGGSDLARHTLDLAGTSDNAGTPSAQDGDLLQFRASDQTWHPVRSIAARLADLSPLPLTPNDPPTLADFHQLVQAHNEMLARLQQP